MVSVDKVLEFVEPVASEATRLLGITDPKNESESYTDSKILSCASIAFSQIESFIKRKILEDTYLERHRKVKYCVCLKHVPVVRVMLVKVKRNPFTSDQDVLEPGVDYILDNGELLFSNRCLLPVVDVTLVGGWSSLEEEIGLYNAFLVQTIAIYHRKESFGLTSLKMGGTTAGVGTVIPTDSGQLVDSARVSLEPFIYYGSAEDLM